MTACTLAPLLTFLPSSSQFSLAQAAFLRLSVPGPCVSSSGSVKFRLTLFFFFLIGSLDWMALMARSVQRISNRQAPVGKCDRDRTYPSQQGTRLPFLFIFCSFLHRRLFDEISCAQLTQVSGLQGNPKHIPASPTSEERTIIYFASRPFFAGRRRGDTTGSLALRFWPRFRSPSTPLLPYLRVR